MSVKTNGRLFVESRTGRYGQFNIAKLVTDIGEFAVKDKTIEEFDEGAYQGSFELGKIFMATTRLKSGALITELRARVDDYALLEDGDVPDDVEIGTDEQDPITEEETPPTEIADEDRSKATGADEVVSADDGNAVASLFGELWPLGETVMLDPATDRSQFRQQRDYLKSNNYKYVPDRKVWVFQQE